MLLRAVSAGGGACNHHVEASRARGGLRQSDRGNLWIGVRHARHGRMIGRRVLASQPPCNHLTVVVSQMREPAEARDVTSSEHTGMRLERRGIYPQPAAVCLSKP